MDHSIGSILFIIITAVATLVKYLNKKKEEEEKRRQSMPAPRPEDLPEATRRMLYGDSQVPTARKRQAPAQPTVIVARPRQVIGEDEDGPRPAPPRPIIPPGPPRQAGRPVHLPIPPRPMQPSRPVFSQPRPAPPASMPSPNAARQIMTGMGRTPDYAPPPAVAPDGDWMRRDQLERGRQAERAQGQAADRANIARKRRIFAAGTDLRRAIIMNEILGPPVALRDPFGPFQSGPCL